MAVIFFRNKKTDFNYSEGGELRCYSDSIIDINYSYPLYSYPLYSYPLVRCDYIDDNNIGFEENVQVTEYSIYPNPATGWFAVKSQGVVKVEVYDMSGRKIAEQQGKAVGFDSSIWNKGIYLVRIIDRNGEVAARKWC